ncbi:MAG: hypothetical protein ACXWC7_10920 [Chitinophagaceae bacterium]
MKQLFFAGLPLFMLFSNGCTKSGNDRPDAIKGEVFLVDKNNQVVSNIPGVFVSVENSNPLQIVAVNSNGEFELPALNSRDTMALVFSHAGYGTVKQYYTQSDLHEVSSVQGVYLHPISSVVVNSLSGTLTGDVFKMAFNVSAPESNAANGVTFFIEKNNAEVSFADCPGNNSVSRFLTVGVTEGNNTASFCLKCAKECGFLQSGDTAYLKAYGDIKSPYGSNYVDLSTNRLVFPSINKTNNSSTIWFVVP